MPRRACTWIPSISISIYVLAPGQWWHNLCKACLFSDSDAFIYSRGGGEGDPQCWLPNTPCQLTVGRRPLGGGIGGGGVREGQMGGGLGGASGGGLREGRLGGGVRMGQFGVGGGSKWADLGF